MKSSVELSYKKECTTILLILWERPWNLSKRAVQDHLHRLTIEKGIGTIIHPDPKVPQDPQDQGLLHDHRSVADLPVVTHIVTADVLSKNVGHAQDHDPLIGVGTKGINHVEVWIKWLMYPKKLAGFFLENSKCWMISRNT